MTRRVLRPAHIDLADWPVLDFVRGVDFRSMTWDRWGHGHHSDSAHLFVDDYRIECCYWRADIVVRASMYQFVTAPDFSIYSDDPKPLADYQQWRSRAVARFWQDQGLNVIPVMQFGRPSHINLDGLSGIKVMAIRGPGQGAGEIWQKGFDVYRSGLDLDQILVFGNRPESLRTDSQIVRIPLKRKVKN